MMEHPGPQREATGLRVGRILPERRSNWWLLEEATKVMRRVSRGNLMKLRHPAFRRIFTRIFLPWI